ncbi:MAG: ThiF family adenylyltransferase [Puniceicoccales bacterium]|jgi:adenylyltransferase/sulfurtransferase|nr:ThiF family adenylyltransferase [Puniceicoccales bacterium]
MLTEEEERRYSRHIRLPQIGAIGQERLCDASVLLLGLGGLGSPAALYLAAAGVGTLGVAEYDTVALHNLQRQILFREDDVGVSKLDAGFATLHALNAQTRLNAHSEGLTPENALELFSQYDLILDGTDNFPTRYLANDAARLARRPLVHGSIFQFTGQVTFFDASGGGPCYRCLFPEMPDPASVPTCEQAGVFGALCGVVGSLMAMEAIKHITGAGTSLSGRLLIADLLAGTTRTVRLPKNAACPLCGSAPHITGIVPENYVFGGCRAATAPTAVTGAVAGAPLEITCETAREWLAGPTAPLLLDVREDDEVAICRIAGSYHIPLGALAERLRELPTERAILVFCHHGQRSMRATQLLREKGYALATNIKGGIDRWAVVNEVGMARY